jgi:hypothetical protein
MSQWSVIANSQAASRFNEGLNKAAKMGMSAAKSMATQVKHAVDERMASSPQRAANSAHLNGGPIDAHGFEMALSEAEEATSATGNDDDELASLQKRSDTYVSEASGDEPPR